MKRIWKSLIDTASKSARLMMARWLRTETGTAGRGKPHTIFQIQEVHILPNFTFIIRFTLRKTKAGVTHEEQEFTHYTEAWDAFRTFAEHTSRAMYSRIDLTEYDWNEHRSATIATLKLSK